MAPHTIETALWCLGVIHGVTSTLTVSAQSWNSKVEYFQPVTINCTSDVNATVKVWILPSWGFIDATNATAGDNHLQLINNGTGLHISRVDDGDFGIYICVIESPSGDIKIVKNGINVDGPYYSPEITDRYKKNAAIGGVAAGVMFIVLLSLWLMCSKLGKSRSTLKLSKGEDDVNTTQVSVQVIAMTIRGSGANAVANNSSIYDAGGILDSNIYDQADGLNKLREDRDVTTTSTIEHRNTTTMPNVNRTDSSLYQSIADVNTGSNGTTTTQQLLQKADWTITEMTDEDKLKIDTNGPIYHNIPGRPEAANNSLVHNDDTIPSQTATERDGGGFIIVSESYSDIHYSAANLITHDRAVHGPDDDVIYAKPIKPRRKQGDVHNDITQTVEGDIVLESNGAKVVVTSSPNTDAEQRPLEEGINEKGAELILTTGIQLNPSKPDTRKI